MHRARILQKTERMCHDAQKRREYYRAISVRATALRFTETVRITEPEQ